MTLDWKALRRRARSAFLLVSALLVGGHVAAQGAPAAATTESQPDATALLKSMADYLAGLEFFRCTTTNGYESVQPNGQKVEFGETREIFLARPNRLRVEEVASDGFSDVTLFDGRQITVVSAGFNVFAQAPQPPSLEDALVYFVRDLRMRAPLALLLSTHVRRTFSTWPRTWSTSSARGSVARTHTTSRRSRNPSTSSSGSPTLTSHCLSAW